MHYSTSHLLFRFLCAYVITTVANDSEGGSRMDNPETLATLDIQDTWRRKTNKYNISAISWQSVLLVEEIGVPGENHRPFASHWQTLSRNVISSTPRLSRIRTHNIRGIPIDCIGSYKSNYYTITTTRRPQLKATWTPPIN